MKYAGGSCRFRAARFSGAGVTVVKRGLLSVAAAAAMMGSVEGSGAFATTIVLPDPTLGGLLYAANQPLSISGPGWHTYGGSASATATARLAAEPFPSVFAFAQWEVSGPGAGPTTASFVELDYDIEITGPTPDVLVDVSGWASISSSAGNGPSVILRVNNPNAILFSLGEPPNKSLFFDIPVSLPTDTPIPVELTANAGDNVGSGSMSAYIDPYFSIDASNADPGAYSILTSPGVGNSPSPGIVIPEPSTWAMLLLGFAGLGWAGYRGRFAARTMGARA